MKRCPQCDFIYEDDQGLCEMDGEELVHDSRSFPVAATPPTQRGLRAKPPFRRFAVLVTAFLLTAALFVIYYRSPRRVDSKSVPVAPKVKNSESGTSIPPTASNTPDREPDQTSLATTDSPGPSPSNAGVTKRRSLRSSAGPSSSPAPNLSPAPGIAAPEELLTQSTLGVPVTALSVRPSSSPADPAAPKPSEDKTKPATQKRESKVSSFFKKAGRLLKKPFSSKPSPK